MDMKSNYTGLHKRLKQMLLQQSFSDQVNIAASRERKRRKNEIEFGGGEKMRKDLPTKPNGLWNSQLESSMKSTRTEMRKYANSELTRPVTADIAMYFHFFCLEFF